MSGDETNEKNEMTLYHARRDQVIFLCNYVFNIPAYETWQSTKLPSVLHLFDDLETKFKQAALLKEK